MDIVSREKRSEMMAGIRSKNTKPELMIRKALHVLGFRYRLHSTSIPGKPDMVLKKYNAVIFIHRCFWHGHSCLLFRLPKTRTEFWKSKIDNNRERDEKIMQELKLSGWRIATIWECALRGKGRMDFETLVNNISEWIQSDKKFMAIEGNKDES